MPTPSFVRLPPDGAGKKLATNQFTDSNGDVVHGQFMHLADPGEPSQGLAIDARGSASVRFSEGQPTLSGFGKLNVSSERALGVYESSSGSYDELFSIDVAGGGASTYDDNGHSVVLSVDGVSGSSVKRTTNRYHYYLPGSASLVKMTLACGDTGKSGNSRRWGPYDDNDGLYFELAGMTVNVVTRSSTTGSVVETKVAQASWNSDKLDGLGVSGMTLDITKINVWWIDYQWLGAGRARFGVFAPDGSRLVCHTFENAGAFPLPYMRSGTLPMRTENVNTGTSGASSELREVCMAMYTEGTYEDYTFWRSSDLDASATAGATNTRLMAVRSKVLVPGLNHHNSIVAYPETLNVYCDQPFRLDIWQDATTTGGTWGVTDTGSSVEASLDTTLSDLIKPFKTLFFGAGAHSVDLTAYFEVNDEGIMLNADGTHEVWAFTGKKLGATDSAVTLNIGYRELW